jgi:cysteine desulfurase
MTDQPVADTSTHRYPDSPIYLDYAATTPVDPRVAEKMLEFMTQRFGNPASVSHSFGMDAAMAVEMARAQVARLINVSAAEIVWTSGATESNNLALKGVAHALRERGRHLVTVTTEHKSVLDSMRRLERQGFEVTYLRPGSDGLLDPNEFAGALRDDTVLASVMLVNNEIGVVQPIAALSEICRRKNVFLHVDAVQAAGKLPVDARELGADLMSLSAHKVYGPKGVGALYVRSAPELRLEAQIDGGGHEQGRRSGTLATHQIVGMGIAFEIARRELQEESARITALRGLLESGLSAIPGVHFNGCVRQRVAHNLNVSFAGARAGIPEQLLAKVAVSGGSACNSASAGPSYVLKELGLSDELARNAIRISIGRFTTDEEIRFVLEQLRQSMPHYS